MFKFEFPSYVQCKAQLESNIKSTEQINPLDSYFVNVMLVISV